MENIFKNISSFLPEPKDRNQSNKKILKKAPLDVITLHHSGILCFSKDRPFQLKCFLETFYLYCKDAISITIVVIYKKNASFHEMYEEVFLKYPQVQVVVEDDFYTDVMNAIDILQSIGSMDNNIMFCVDDMIFHSDFSIISLTSAIFTGIIIHHTH